MNSGLIIIFLYPNISRQIFIYW